MAEKSLLRGITWDHSRAYPPLTAAAQRYGELHPSVAVQWTKRSLHDFGHADVATLAGEFDLIVIDHPWAGQALANGSVLALEGLADTGLLTHLSSNTIGASFGSYVYNENLIALPIDAATQVASYRSDLLEREGISVPETWDDVLALARRGRVIAPGFHVDVLLTVLGFCVSLGAKTCDRDETAIPMPIGVDVLRRMRELAAHLPEEAWGYNPIAVYEQMSVRDDFAYCPFAYGYQNYSRKGFAPSLLNFASLVNLSEGTRLRGVLGGTGIAVSTQCKDPQLAIAFCEYVASDECQKHMYLLSGGQPSAEAVWKDPFANALTGNFFCDTYRDICDAWVRPRYDGYISFQESAGVPIVAYLRNGGDEHAVIDAVNQRYRNSLKERSH